MIEPAVAYRRTSSAANVRRDCEASQRERDSDTRQREAIQRYAVAAGLEIVAEFYDAAVSGADPIDQREGFTSLLAWAQENDMRIPTISTSHSGLKSATCSD
jgi:DNA invertase Pin-like site-specific DNA recombinase